MSRNPILQVQTELTLREKSTDIEALLARLSDIEPKEMAEALCTIEFHKELNKMLARHPAVDLDLTKLFFSRGLKDEIQAIYLELAKHLRAESHGASNLMNAVFDFFSSTIKSLLKVPHFFSNN